jgi:hypothetical protein
MCMWKGGGKKNLATSSTPVGEMSNQLNDSIPYSPWEEKSSPYTREDMVVVDGGVGGGGEGINRAIETVRFFPK